ncbi:tyrosine kinase catalytic domain protein [Rhizoctonia solani AG-3 Rhs1AP]|uniref:Tyrosine kinase catalytic domain protein n=1 Tax=Rhizoctonia solani AG-3 Rhs1AP TaxID=1086054 RepID=A0A0A1UJF7_9AGAM|nr:tyrosine kinase catalytic domain protein [Rhizoctonia solani AG-3 Rhs1AP]
MSIAWVAIGRSHFKTRLQPTCLILLSQPTNHFLHIRTREKMSEPKIAMKPTISSTMTMSEICPHFTMRGIHDLTNAIQWSGENPIAGGGFADIYDAILDPLSVPSSSSSLLINRHPARGSSNVHNSHPSRPSGMQVVIKVRRSVPDSPDYAKQIASHIYKWSKCEHPNVLQLLGFAMFQGRIGLVLPWAEKGTVMSYFRARPSASLRDRFDKCVEICSGVEYLHSIGIVHGDIKGENVVISADDTAMLTDLDDAKLEERSLFFTGKQGVNALSLRWAAPELLVAEHMNKTQSSDVYALGMTILEVLTGRPPDFGSDNIARIAVLISSGNYPIRWDPLSHNNRDDIWNLLVRCWQYTPQARPNAKYVKPAILSMPPRNWQIFYSEEYFDDEPLSLPSADSMKKHAVVRFPFPPILRRPRVQPINSMPISRKMDLKDVISQLAVCGCQNISEQIDESTFGTIPSLYGGSGDVYCGSLLDSTLVCVKVPRFANDASQRAESQAYASREIHTWNKCKHPNILPFLGLAAFRDRVATISPWIKNGTMQNYLKQHSDADRCRLSTQICTTVAYLHSINVVHGDLKGDNVLISDDGSALLMDFGSSDLENRTLKFTHLMNQCGWTMRWGAPELLQEITPSSKESDVYALGMTILEAITGQLPFPEKQEMAVLLAVCVRQEIPTRPAAQIPVNSQNGDKLWELLCECWSREMEKRPSAAQVESVMKTITKESLAPAE